MAKTLLEVDERLLEEARVLAKARTKRGAVETALREFVRRRRLEGLAAAAGTSSMRWTATDVRSMREGR